MFDNLHREIKELRGENVELKKSLEFSQYEIDSLKKRIPEVQNVLNNVGSVDLTNRIRLLEDQGKKKTCALLDFPNYLRRTLNRRRKKFKS